MSDLAFNNYCITCDQLCSHSSIYCSDQCRSIDEQQSSHIIHRHEDNTSINSSAEKLVSPLLTPNLYSNYGQSNGSQHDVSNSPLLLPSNYNASESTGELDYIDLNYSVKFNTNYALATNSNTSSNDLLSNIPSTSHNYRKWLTACL